MGRIADSAASVVDRKGFSHDGFQMNRPLDQTDWRIIAELQRDGRLSYNQLARRVNLSSPAVAERVRRLEESGVITGYQARIDPARAGLPLTAFVQMRCALGQLPAQDHGGGRLPRGRRGAQAQRQLVLDAQGAGRVDAAPRGAARTARRSTAR